VDAEFAQGVEALDAEVQAGEIKKMLGGEHDRKERDHDIIGAGGTESQDWARCCSGCTCAGRSGAASTREVIDYQPGEEAGLKSVTVRIAGEYAYGLLAAEAACPARAHLAFDQAPTTQVSPRPRLAGAAGGRDIQIDDKDCGSNLPVERRRRPAR